MASVFRNANGTTLAQAWYLNNRFILHKTMGISPKLLDVEFNSDSISKASSLPQDLAKAGVEPSKDSMGVVHDRDVVALLGDPKWAATLDESREACAVSTTGNGPKSVTLTAAGEHKGRWALW